MKGKSSPHKIERTRASREIQQQVPPTDNDASGPQNWSPTIRNLWGPLLKSNQLKIKQL
ncbi:hypothetical protein Syun_003724 [Stephania yunnanensis]|uniref:Uncharacterized protein n=1 Tax=Stephania yunnanensis TaxID=152371 RepID=A0AAP0L1N3_9MAGN